jgi:hypothetical protein
MRLAVLLACLLPGIACAGEAATARFAPAQLEMASESLQRARDAVVVGDRSLARSLAWQASVDARLAWRMSESWAVRAPAARIFDEARKILFADPIAAAPAR